MCKKLVLFTLAILCVTGMAYADLIDKPTPPPAPTKPAIADLVAKQKKDATVGYTQMKFMQRNSYNQIWHNPWYKPQDFFDAYGTDACKLFQANDGMNTALAASDSTFVPLAVPDGYTVTLNNDCTVVATETTNS